MSNQPILILGGGINGAAAARELALNGQDVWLVDSADLAFGATAYSSRLIHGGLRYLEFGEFSLVKESLQERGRLLRLAPHLVKPLRLFIPVRNSWGGLTQAAGKFLGLPLRSKQSAHRGLRVVQVGLWLYDRYASEDELPPRSLHQLDEPKVPHVSPAVAKQLWAYSDAQITYPERLVIALLDDARAARCQPRQRVPRLHLQPGHAQRQYSCNRLHAMPTRRFSRPQSSTLPAPGSIRRSRACPLLRGD